MKVSIRFFTIVFILLFLMPFDLSAASVLTLDKRGNGNDQCNGRYECIEISHDHSDVFKFDIRITINQASPNYPYSFPWKMRAIDEDGFVVGYSDSIDDYDFQDHHENNELRAFTTQVSLLHGGLMRAITENCYIDECGKEYSSLNLTFKLFSGDFEVLSTCNSLQHPDLAANSQELAVDFRTCQCFDRSINRPINYTHTENPIIDNFVAKEEVNQKLIPHGMQTKDISVYPNPTDSKINIKLGNTTVKVSKVELFSMQGQLVEVPLNKNYQNRITLDVSHVPDGAYLLKIIGYNGNIGFKRVIINK